MSGIQYPVDMKDIDKFEHQNNSSVNVYGYEDKTIFPLHITILTTARYHVNLLYIAVGEKSDYVLAKDLNRLVSIQYNHHKHKTYFYQCCLHGCTSEEVLKNHLERCKLHVAQRIRSQRLSTRSDVTQSSLQNQNTTEYYVYLLSSTRISKVYYVNKTRVSHRHQNPSLSNTNITYHVEAAST